MQYPAPAVDFTSLGLLSSELSRPIPHQQLVFSSMSNQCRSRCSDVSLTRMGILQLLTTLHWKISGRRPKELLLGKSFEKSRNPRRNTLGKSFAKTSHGAHIRRYRPSFRTRLVNQYLDQPTQKHSSESELGSRAPMPSSSAPILSRGAFYVFRNEPEGGGQNECALLRGWILARQGKFLRGAYASQV
ncbi:hypothetical protein WG66_012078 [Moniliophthora roreri]|nr:hypothetical protein WG66_012078 [Moniliophthora roreri]